MDKAPHPNPYPPPKKIKKICRRITYLFPEQYASCRYSNTTHTQPVSDMINIWKYNKLFCISSSKKIKQLELLPVQQRETDTHKCLLLCGGNFSSL